MDNVTKAYIPINFTYYNPATSPFKTGRNARERVTVYKCNNCENCNAYKNNKCILMNFIYGIRCPYGYIHSEEGLTKSAKNCGKLIRKYEKEYGDIKYKISSADSVYSVGDYIFVPLPHVTGVASCFDKSLFYSADTSGFLIERSKFTIDFIVSLFSYRPITWFGNSIIKSYESESLPKFAFQLYKNMKEMYNSVLEVFPQIEEYTKKYSFVGKKAKVTTLLPSDVNMCSNIWKWDGKVMSINLKSILMFPSDSKISDEVVYFEPGSEVVVRITNNDSVTDSTVFV